MPVDLSPVIGSIPFRLALSGGWIDQPFVSRSNPDGIGSMVVAQILPAVPIMNRSGLATGTRKVISRLWGNSLPDKTPEQLVKELYKAENDGRPDPSGSQDMIGLLYPGISRLDYSFSHEGGVFPVHIERCTNPAIAAWLSSVIHVIPVAPRPPGYSPLGVRNVTSELASRLGRSGKACFDAILSRDVLALGAAMNDCTDTWDEMMPHIFRHPVLELDLLALLNCYRKHYPGVMYSGCGGGYLYIVSPEGSAPPPGSFQVTVTSA